MDCKHRCRCINKLLIAPNAGSIPQNPDALFYSGGVRQAALNWSKELGAPDVIIDPSPRDDYFTQMMTSRWATLVLQMSAPAGAWLYYDDGAAAAWLPRDALLAGSVTCGCISCSWHVAIAASMLGAQAGGLGARCQCDEPGALHAGTACHRMALAGASAPCRLWPRAVCPWSSSRTCSSHLRMCWTMTPSRCGCRGACSLACLSCPLHVIPRDHSSAANHVSGQATGTVLHCSGCNTTGIRRLHQAARVSHMGSSHPAGPPHRSAIQQLHTHLAAIPQEEWATMNTNLKK